MPSTRVDSGESLLQDAAGVFVVDDDEGMRKSLRQLFTEAEIPVQTFSRPGEFLDHFHPDLSGCLVLDLAMPEMDGVELYRNLVERGCRMPFIMITGNGDVPRVIEAFRQGAVDFIEKPFRFEQLLERVRESLDKAGADAARHNERAGFEKLRHSLTPRELEVMDLLVRGKSTKQAARELGISAKTAYIHRARVLEKMKVDSVAQLVQRVHQTSPETGVADDGGV